MSILDTEAHRVRVGLQRVDLLEEVTHRLEAHPRDDVTDLTNLLRQVEALEWETIPPVQVSIAADILGLDGKTVRAWAQAGVLQIAETEPVLKVDGRSVHDVAALLRELREAGQTRGLLESLWRRVVDAETLTGPGLQESLEEARRGETVPLVVPAQYDDLAPL